MSTVLNVLLDMLLGGSLVFFVVVMIDLVVREQNRGERLYRAMALIAGAVVALGAQAAHVGFASYTVNALSGARAGGSFFTTVSVVLPGGVGATFGWYFLRVMKRSTAKGLRLISFLGMLTLVAFAEIFAQATNVKGVELGQAAIPNSSFVAGLILSLLVLGPEPGAEPENRPSRLGPLFGNLLARRAQPGVSAASYLASARADDRTSPPGAPTGFIDPFEE